MPLYSVKTIVGNLKLVVWELNESLKELESGVNLSLKDDNRLKTISRDEKRKEFLAGRYVVKKSCKLLGIEYSGFEKDIYGKPFIPGKPYEISLTHTEEYIAVVFSPVSPVGIDLEKPRDKIVRVLPRLFSLQERMDIGDDREKATIFWSAKEALYKLYGKRGVFFKENLFLRYQDELLTGRIEINDFEQSCSFYIESIGKYYLVIAY